MMVLLSLTDETGSGGDELKSGGDEPSDGKSNRRSGGVGGTGLGSDGGDGGVGEDTPSGAE